ncbi:MAG: FAD-dependent oxidoreductase [Clostridia bacterium]|nr:FAD-dependent oxidoreductase [Clostridia bacterium]
MPTFPTLRGDVSADVLIIGGGMAGILCALALRKKGIDCILVEAKRLGGGVTTGTTAVLTAQHSTLYSEISAMFGMEKAGQYLKANLSAVEKFRELSKDIPCDFEDKPSFIYTRTDTAKLEREVRTLHTLGFHAEYVTETPLPFPVGGAVKYPGMAQFHPLKFIAGATNGLKIYENTFVHRVKDCTAYIDGGKITAKSIIIATHYPFINKHGLYFMKLYQMRSFVAALENGPDLAGTYETTAERGAYFRNYKNYLLVGGGDHRTGARDGGFSAVEEYVKSNFTGLEVKYAWATQDCMSLDGIPYIGKYSPSTPNIYVATGFNEWGMTSSMAAADILADMITGANNDYAPVFSPDRSIVRKQLFKNLGQTFADFILPLPKRCPHLGCALRWNPEERTWDCPCHGSRFDEHGGLIDNPAMRDASVE